MISNEELSPTQMIADFIQILTDWRGVLLEQLRSCILDADRGMVEDWKRDAPVWTRGGNIVSVAVFRDHLKLTFFKGAFLADPQSLFNSGLDAKISRCIEFDEGDTIDEPALKALVKAAVEYNLAKVKKVKATVDDEHSIS